MSEIGIDISGQSSKTKATYEGQTFDRVITVCSDAVEACPYFPGARSRDHWDLDDPVAATGTEEERLGAFRRVRDEIADRVRGLINGN
jgi:arsenate reductase